MEKQITDTDELGAASILRLPGNACPASETLETEVKISKVKIVFNSIPYGFQ